MMAKMQNRSRKAAKPQRKAAAGMPDRELRRRAKEIADWLFTNGFGESADRLVLVAFGARYIGSLAWRPVCDFIFDQLRDLAALRENCGRRP